MGKFLSREKGRENGCSHSTAALTVQHGGSGTGLREGIDIPTSLASSTPICPSCTDKDKMNTNGCWLLLLYACEVGVSLGRLLCTETLEVALSLRYLVNL